MTAYSPGNPEYVDGRSVICYDDISQLSGAVLSASATATAAGTATYDAANAFDGLTYDYWKPSTGGAQWLKIALAASAVVDYLGLAAHNLGTLGATVQLQGSLDDATYVNLLPEGTFVPTDDGPIVRLFTEKAYRYFKLTTTPPSGTQQIGVLMLGRSTPLQRGVHVGHRPAPFSRDVRYTTNESEGGNFLGRSIVRVSNETEIALSNMTARWYREKFEPFALQAESRPFFFVWDRHRRPDEAMFGYATNRPSLENGKTSFVSTTLSMRGKA